LGGLIASTYVANKEYIKGKYRLNQLLDLEKQVAEAVKISIPFNNMITGTSAFSHKVRGVKDGSIDSLGRDSYQSCDCEA